MEETANTSSARVNFFARFEVDSYRKDSGGLVCYYDTYLPKVRPVTKTSDFLTTSVGACLSAHCSALFDDVKLLAPISLAAHGCTVLETLLLQCIRNGKDFVLRQLGQDRYALEEAFVHIPFRDGALHQYHLERHAVESPQSDGTSGDARRRTGRVVHDRQLAEGISVSVGCDELPFGFRSAFAIVAVALPRALDEDVHGTAVDDVEVISVVTLLNDDVVLLLLDEEHGILDSTLLFLVEVHEQNVLLEDLAYAFGLLLGLGNLLHLLGSFQYLVGR
mmetsp:Transcript_37164/g.68830  ORF Transcript_37164/g.68830 Transcript_37164/m.68830 type:complete len:277 (+) Transcript_37164:659-1489(+)